MTWTDRPRRTIDTLAPVETPDGIELPLNPAGPIPRGGAWLLDLVIRAALLFALGWLLAWLQAVGLAVMLLAWFLINWWYPVLFEVLSHGATPGKRVARLKVMMQDGTPISWGASIVRNLVRQVDFLPLFYTTGLIAMLSNARFQRLGDLAAGTVVIRTGREANGRGSLPEGPAEPVPIALNADEQRTILDLAERSVRLNPERAADLCNQLSPLTGLDGSAGVARVQAWARALRGGQP
ncbi:RDD family protein [Wenzhouxiangella marina]|uniref:Membrane protein n=1 Tax=Wenzhouxiangella marina TaxID=1579979 RepID=A0A0K0XV80_9GAMM|nr:RDD family protein [Wenzhouxiangella marina]AKS41575.1 membrane protein [Wenzhouxiangella marina]MBB6086666.1 putative RDD family membrane protein YckC [Wenzhouxiangella marina]